MQLLSVNDVSVFVASLRSGQSAIFPTETSYGLGCDATNQAAVDVIFKIKDRSDTKPLLIVVPTVAMAERYLVWNRALEQLARKYWPGPLTIVGEYNTSAVPALAKGVVGADGTVAVRVSADHWLQRVTSELSRPLVATSANISGQEALYDSAQAGHIFKGHAIGPDVLADGGVLLKVPATTLVRIVGGALEVLRQGGLKIVLE